MRAREIMSAPVITESPWSMLKHLADLMLKLEIGCIPIVDVEGHLLGVVSEQDILKLQSVDDPRLHVTPQHALAQKPPTIASQVMSTMCVTTNEDDDVTNVAREMLAHKVRHVVIVEDRKVVGIISRRDILRALARSDKSIQRELDAKLAKNAGLLGRFTARVSGGTVTLNGPSDESSRRLAQIVAESTPGVVEVDFEEASAARS